MNIIIKRAEALASAYEDAAKNLYRRHWSCGGIEPQGLPQTYSGTAEVLRELIKEIQR